MSTSNEFKEYITLCQLLKKERIVSSGGEAKMYLETHPVYVNGIHDNRRGRKLYEGDEVKLEKQTIVVKFDHN